MDEAEVTWDLVAAIERENRRYAMLWRALTAVDKEPGGPAEHLRRTARGAAEDWLERKDDDDATEDPF